MTTVARATRFVRRALDALLLVLIVLALAAIVLARVIPWITGGSTLVVSGGSMEPTIRVIRWVNTAFAGPTLSDTMSPTAS